MNRRSSSGPAAATPVRHYRPAIDVATACGIRESELQHRYAPEDWASPRDFTYARSRMLYAEESLPRLVGALHAGGRHSAAILLQDWSVKITKERIASEQAEVSTDRVLPVQRELVERSADELNHELVVKSHPSDRESARFKWEDAG